MSSPKTLAILGATGKQGSSVLSAVLASPLLTTAFPSIRALVRSPSSPASQALLSLSPSITLHPADVSAPSTLLPALRGVHTLYAMTVPASPSSPQEMEDTEYATGVALVDAAIAAGVSTIIWSTLPSYRALSGGKFGRVAVFEAKARVEDYIRAREAEGKVRGVYVSPGWFFENFVNAGHFMSPKPTGADGEWEVALPVRRGTRIPLVDGGRDTGRFVAGVLEGLEKGDERFVGRTVPASEGMYTIEEAVEVLGRATGRRVVFREVDPEEWEAGLRAVAGGVAGILADAMGALREFGQYSTNNGEEDEMIRWALENTGAKVRTLEEFMADGPKQLPGGGELRFAGNGGQ